MAASVMGSDHHHLVGCSIVKDHWPDIIFRVYPYNNTLLTP
jgi:hypothetical protein